MSNSIDASGPAWFAIVNSGWFGVLFGVVSLVFATVLSIILYRRSKPFARLRAAIVEQPLVGLAGDAGPGRLELHYDGVVVPRVTSASVGLWNDGTSTFRGSDIVAVDTLRVLLTGEGRLLQVDLEAVTRVVTDVDILLDAKRAAQIRFDYLDPGDGFRLRVIHSGEPGELSLVGTLRGLPEGITHHQRSGEKPRWMQAMMTVASLAFVAFVLYATVRGMMMSSGAELLQIGSSAVLFFGGFITVEIIRSRLRRRRLAGVPAAVTGDPALSSQLTRVEPAEELTRARQP